ACAGGAREDRLLRTLDAALDRPVRQLSPRQNFWTCHDAGALPGARAESADAGPQPLSDGRGRSRAGSDRRAGRRGAGGVGGAAAECDGGAVVARYARRGWWLVAGGWWLCWKQRIKLGSFR